MDEVVKVSFFKRFILLFISNLIVAIPVFVLIFSILPHYVRFTEPYPLHLAVLQGLIWAVLMASIMLVIERFKKQ